MFPMRCHGTIRRESAACGAAAEGDEQHIGASPLDVRFEEAEAGTAIMHARTAVANAIADRDAPNISRRVRIYVQPSAGTRARVTLTKSLCPRVTYIVGCFESAF
jgi:hypothetical protein